MPSIQSEQRSCGKSSKLLEHLEAALAIADETQDGDAGLRIEQALDLQDIRARIRGYGRPPSSNIFTTQTIHDGWAAHYGGRTELQFNIGVEEGGELTELRHGVAFSFQPSQSLPSIDVLVPKVRRSTRVCA